MKLAGRILAVVVVALAVGLYTHRYFAQVRHVSPAEFAAKGRLLSGTVHDTTFIGVHHGRAYLKEWRMWPVVGARTQVLWTEADGLSPEVLRELEVSVKQEP